MNLRKSLLLPFNGLACFCITASGLFLGVDASNFVES